jgi:hypothetical protein
MLLCQASVFPVLLLLSGFISQCHACHMKAKDIFQNFFITKMREQCLNAYA